MVEISSRRSVALIGAPVDGGAGMSGCIMGPAALRVAQQLVDILSYHVLPTKVMSSDLPAGTNDVKTLKSGGDETITVKVMGGKVMIDDATVVTADVAADNGVIHIIDKVILPSD